MKSFLSVVLILLCGMLSLTGYSSTTTPTTKKMDIIEKASTITAIVVNEVSIPVILVENQAIDVGVPSMANINTTFYHTPNQIITENDYLTPTQYTELVPGSIYKRCQGHI